jgi:hypothetical protein
MDYDNPSPTDSLEARIARNVEALVSKGASDDDIDEYVKLERQQAGTDFSDVESGRSATAHKEPSDLERLATGEKKAAPYGYAKKFLTGALFNFGDEAVAGARSVHGTTADNALRATPIIGSAYDALTSGIRERMPYRQALNEEREGERQFDQAHPVGGKVAEFAGAIAPAVLSGGTSVAGRLGLTGLKALVAEGALAGSLGGAGASQEGQRLRGAGIGAMVGGGTALGLGAAGKALTTAAEYVAPNALRRVGDALSTVLPRGLRPRSHGDVGDDFVNGRLDFDGTTPAELRARVQANPNTKPEILLDYGGPNVLGAAEAAGAVPSAGKTDLYKFLDLRRGTRRNRIAGNLDAQGLPQQNVPDLIESMRASRKATAKPLYEKAFQQGVVDDPVFNSFLQTEEGQAARSIAQDIKRRSVVADRQQAGVPFTDADYTLPATPDVETLHYMKLALDDMVKHGYVPPGGKASTVNRVNSDLVTSFRNRLKALVPDYAKAADTYAGDFAEENALHLGRDILKQDSRETAQAISGMTKGERDQFKIGAADAILGKIESGADKSDLVKRIVGNPKLRSQLRQAFDSDQEFERFAAEMQREARMLESERIFNGSRTTPLKQNIDDMAGVPIDNLISLGRGNPIPTLLGMVSKGDKRANLQAVSDATASRLLAGRNGRAELMSALQALERARNPIRAGRYVTSPAAILAGAAAGNTPGSN